MPTIMVKVLGITMEMAIMTIETKIITETPAEAYPSRVRKTPV